jgi:hypothetical protein
VCEFEKLGKFLGRRAKMHKVVTVWDSKPLDEWASKGEMRL